MENKRISEKESLEIITDMLQQSKQNMEVGQGNQFLIYGYSALVLSIVVFCVVHLTGNAIWSALWFLMFAPSIVLKLSSRHTAERCDLHRPRHRQHMERHRLTVPAHHRRHDRACIPHRLLQFCAHAAPVAHLCQHRYVDYRCHSALPSAHPAAFPRICHRPLHADGPHSRPAHTALLASTLRCSLPVHDDSARPHPQL